MLKSCKYCGLIHPSGFICPKKPAPAKHRNPVTDRFRRSYIWQKKQKTIVQRDFYLCRICNDAHYGVFTLPWQRTLLQVHHIEPLEESFERRLEDSNLLTCCTRHHELAEAGAIPRDYLHGLAETSPRWGADFLEALCQDQQQAPGDDEV